MATHDVRGNEEKKNNQSALKNLSYFHKIWEEKNKKKCKVLIFYLIPSGHTLLSNMPRKSPFFSNERLENSVTHC